MGLERGRLLVDETLRGADWCRAYAGRMDAWLERLLVAAAGGDTEGLALAAVGGFGRSELCPQSDIDVFLLHDRRTIGPVAERLWYPIWDEGIHLGHNVSTVRQAMSLASDDLETATALLSARHVAGDHRLTIAMAEGAANLWERKSRRWLADLGARVAMRHQKAGEVAFVLEPNLKEGRGGLRDRHALTWAQAAHRTLLPHDEPSLSRAYSVLLDARVELQRQTGRASNVLSLQDQEAVGAALGYPDPDALMAAVAEAARTIAWISDDTWRRIRLALRGPLGRTGRRYRVLDHDIRLRDGEVCLAEDARLTDPTLALRTAVAAAEEHVVIERQSLEILARSQTAFTEKWPVGCFELFVRLLRAGRPAIGVIEALDQRGVWTKILPEWQGVRARPQRNPYHRYTVDRHLLEAAANASRLTALVERADLLVVAALLHDIGKGRPGDHTEAGVAVAGPIAVRMGLPPEDVATVVALVELHLLLPDVALRRDLDDANTIGRVAAKVGSTSRLRLLAALTEADSLATGPSAWSLSKAGLVGVLVERTAAHLGGQPIEQVVDDAFASNDLTAATLQPDGVEAAGDTLTVIGPDRPGGFSRVAGVLALHGLDVVRAVAHSLEDGRAMARFQVVDQVREEIPWLRVKNDVDLALQGRLALAARLDERARTYRRRGATGSRTQVALVSFDVDASWGATVIDVQAVDRVGVLYRITRAFAELDLDIRSARVQTLGHDVVDTFYVRDSNGEKISDGLLLDEIERAILHSLDA